VVTKLIYEDPQSNAEDDQGDGQNRFGPQSDYDDANAQFDGREQALINQQERMGLVTGVVTDGEANRYNPANPFNESKFIDPEKLNGNLQNIGGGIATNQAPVNRMDDTLDGHFGVTAEPDLNQAEEPEHFNPYAQNQSEGQLIPSQNQVHGLEDPPTNVNLVVQQGGMGIEMAKQPQMLYQQEIAEISNINDVDGYGQNKGDETRDLPNLLKDLEMYNHDNASPVQPQIQNPQGSGSKDEGYDPYNF